MSAVVTQADREAAAPFGGLIEDEIRAGQHDSHPFVQAFARHRTEATEELVSALDRAREWIARDDSPMGPCEARLHRKLLERIDALIAKHRDAA